MLAIARALMSRPRLLLCDEVSLGLAPIVVAGAVRRPAAQSTRTPAPPCCSWSRTPKLALDIAPASTCSRWARVAASGPTETFRDERRHPTRLPRVLTTTSERTDLGGDLPRPSVLRPDRRRRSTCSWRSALVVVFRAPSTINFAQGEFALFTCFIAWWLTEQGLADLAGHGRRAWPSGFAAGCGGRADADPARGRRNETAVLIVALGLFTALNGLDGWIWGSANKTVPAACSPVTRTTTSWSAGPGCTTTRSGIIAGR